MSFVQGFAFGGRAIIVVKRIYENRHDTYGNPVQCLKITIFDTLKRWHRHVFSGDLVQQKVIHMPGMVSILATFAAVISSLSLLMPASPSWVALGGTGAMGAGSVTAVLMTSTVATQLFVVQRLLAKLGWTFTLVAGTLLMGLASPVQAIAPDLTLALVSSLLRGIGFGIITVSGSTALSLLIPVARRGQAVGIYGLAAAIPQMILTPLTPWMIETLGYRFVLCSGLIAVLGAPFAIHLGKLVTERLGEITEENTEAPAGMGTVLKKIWPALATLTLITAAGGAFLTFSIDIAPTAAAASVALLCFTALAAPARVMGGSLSDRFGTRLLMTPVLGLAALGAVLIGFSVSTHDAALRWILLISGALLVGIGYGFLQSITMVRALNDAGAANTTRASVAWNANFDLGTGLGGIALGAIAQAAGFPFAWYVWAGLMAVSVVVMGVRDIRETRANSPQ